MCGSLPPPCECGCDAKPCGPACAGVLASHRNLGVPAIPFPGCRPAVSSSGEVDGYAFLRASTIGGVVDTAVTAIGPAGVLRLFCRSVEVSPQPLFCAHVQVRFAILQSVLVLFAVEPLGFLFLCGDCKVCLLLADVPTPTVGP